VTTGSLNIGIGMNAGRGITTGNNNTILGSVIGLPAELSDSVYIATGTGAVRFMADNQGRVGLGGITTPTAKLELPAGSTTVAPFKLTSGSVLTTPENGTFEYDGVKLYFTVGGVRKTVNLT
jgi:hypothetical protein